MMSNLERDVFTIQLCVLYIIIIILAYYSVLILSKLPPRVFNINPAIKKIMHTIATYDVVCVVLLL